MFEDFVRVEKALMVEAIEVRQVVGVQTLALERPDELGNFLRFVAHGLL